MALITITGTTIPSLVLPTTGTVYLRATLSRNVITTDNSGNTVILNGSESYFQWALTPSGGGYTIPAITLYSTRDAIAGPEAVWKLTFVDASGNHLGNYRGFERTAIPGIFLGGVTMDWDDVYNYNHPQSPIFVDRSTYNRDQIIALVDELLGGGAGASSLDELTDVVITTPASGHHLRHNGTNWVNAAIPAGDLPSHSHAWGDVSKVGSSLADLATRSASDLVSGTLAEGRLPTGINANKIADGTVENAEFQFLNGVTSAIQTQIDGKAAAAHTHTPANVVGSGIANRVALFDGSDILSTDGDFTYSSDLLSAPQMSAGTGGKFGSATFGVEYFGTVTADIPLLAERFITGSLASFAKYGGLYAGIQVAGTNNGNSTVDIQGIRGVARINAAHTAGFLGYLQGANFMGINEGTGNLTNLYGAAIASFHKTASTVTTQVGVNAYTEINGGGTTTNLFGVAGVVIINTGSDVGTGIQYNSSITVDGSGTTMADGRGFNSALVMSNSAAVTTFYGFRMGRPSLATGATVTTLYGVYISDLAAITGVTTAYGLYAAGASMNNHIEGNLSVGGTISGTGAGGGVLTLNEGAAPGTPASGKVALYAKADGLLYSKDDAGVETVVTGGGGGGGATANPTVSVIPYLSAASVYSDSPLLRADANTIEQRNGATAQRLSIYDFYTDTSNYRRAGLFWDASDEFNIVAEFQGTGTRKRINLSGNDLDFYTAGNQRLRLDSSGHLWPITDGALDLGLSGNAFRDLWLTRKLTLNEAAAPGTPSGGKVVLYAKADGLLYSKDDAGTETLVSGGSGGGSGYTLAFSSSNALNPADSTSYYVGYPKIGYPMGAAGWYIDLARIKVPKAGTIKAVTWNAEFIDGVAGSNENITVSVCIGNTAGSEGTCTSILTTETWNAATLVSQQNVTGLSIAVAAGDGVVVKFATPAWATNPTAVTVRGHIYIE